MWSTLQSWYLLSTGRRLPHRLPRNTENVIREAMKGAEEAQGIDDGTEWVWPRMNVVLFSGGMDSFIAYRQAKANGDDVWAVTVAFNTPYVNKELAACSELVQDDDHIIVDLRCLDVEHRRSEWSHIIPLRNLICIEAGAEFVECDGYVWLSSLRGELRGDKSLGFMRAAADRVLDVYNVHTPFENMTKADTALMYVTEKLGPREQLLETVTCFSGSNKHCGKCRACLRRFLALRWAGYTWDEMLPTYDVHPLVGAAAEVARYREVMGRAMAKRDFSYYDIVRCVQDLTVIGFPDNNAAVDEDINPDAYDLYKAVLLDRSKFIFGGAAD
jgi:7-cyano-7-deazaguanine synthase in queuosine biosynthesis